MYNNNSYNNSNSSSYGSRSSYGNRPQQQYGNARPPYNARPDVLPPEIKAEPLPADFVDLAEQVMRKHAVEKPVISTSKIRNLLSIVSDIYNAENLRTEKDLLAESITGLTMMRIRTVYESGRDEGVKSFVREAKLLEYLKDIGTDRAKLINYSHYMEALVAYHRFLIKER